MLDIDPTKWDRCWVNLGALCSVGPTPIHPELGCEKAEGTEELYGSPSGISVLVPGSLFITLRL